MRNRTFPGRPALSGIVCLTIALSLAGCGGNGTYNPAVVGGGSSTPVASFSLTVTPSVQTIAPGDTTTYVATITPVNGFAQTVSLSVAGLPAGTTGTFGPLITTSNGSGQTSTLTVTTTAGPGSLTGTIQSVKKPTRDATPATPNGNYTLTVAATGGNVSRQAGVTLAVQSGPVTNPITPEPGTLALLIASSVSAAGILIRRRRRK